MHFAIAVVTHSMPSEADIMDALAPFQENNMGDVPQEYLEFCPIDDEEVNGYKEEYEEKTIEKDGQERPIKELMSFREYMTEHVQYEYDEATQQYGYYSNPNSQWDWWQIGGRYCAEVNVPVNCDCIIGSKTGVTAIQTLIKATICAIRNATAPESRAWYFPIVKNKRLRRLASGKFTSRARSRRPMKKRKSSRIRSAIRKNTTHPTIKQKKTMSVVWVPSCSTDILRTVSGFQRIGTMITSLIGSKSSKKKSLKTLATMIGLRLSIVTCKS